MPENGQTEVLYRLQRLLGEQFDINLDTGRISKSGRSETIADYDPEENRLWSYITVYAYDAADMSDDSVIELARDAIARDGDDMRAMGWMLIDASDSLDDGPEEVDEGTRHCGFEIEHDAPSPDVVATLLMGPVAPPFEFET